MNVSLSYYTNTGQRKNNEDAVSVLENAHGLLAIVADGVGGQDNGEYASQLAVKTLNDSLGAKAVSPDELEAAIIQANTDVHAVQEQHHGAQTTIAALWLGEQFAVAMHVGDTRIYQFRNGQVVFQTADHSMAQIAVMAGDIKLGDIRKSRDRNKLFRALGDSSAPKVASRLLDIRSGDRLLLCSDGFWEKILEPEMVEAMKRTRNAEEWLREMRSIAEPEAADNNTAIAIVIN